MKQCAVLHTLGVWVAVCLGTSAAHAALVSISFDLQPVQFNGNTVGVASAVPTGEPLNPNGLKLPGQTGAWNSLAVGNGQLSLQFSQPVSVTVDDLTFTFNTNASNQPLQSGSNGGDYETVNASGNNDLRSHVIFQRAGSTTHTPRAWELTGLAPTKTYDLILFGQSSANNPAAFSVTGHDAGNGTSNPVTLDADGDGNFQGVAPTPSGVIAGFFDTPSGSAFAAWSGLQILEIPEPASASLLLGAAALVLKRRRA